MTNIPTKQEIDKALETAPDYVKEYVTSDELFEAFEEIREKNKLHLDEAGKLTDALVAVFLKMRPMSEFPALLKESLEQNASTYDAVLKVVNENIFNHFRARLQNPTEENHVTPTLKNAEQKLESNTNDRNSFVEVDTLDKEKEEQDTMPVLKQPNTETASSPDPYREPIE